MGERARAVMFKSDFHRDTNRRNEAKLGSNFPGGLYRVFWLRQWYLFINQINLPWTYSLCIVLALSPSPHINDEYPKAIKMFIYTDI